MSLQKVEIPEGKIGPWAVEQFSISEDDIQIENMRYAFKGIGHRMLQAGTYTRLMCGRTIVMSDTPAEMCDHWAIVRYATGNVLLNGLGIGMVLRNVLAKDCVTNVTVVEKSPDVIALVGPHYTDSRVAIIEADALTWKPPKGKRFNAVWHDIWNDICADNLSEIHKLHRRYGRIADWQGSWGRAECERHR